MRRRDRFIWIPTVIGLLLIGFVVWNYYRANQFDQYFNQQYKYSLKYPKEWSRQENKLGVSVIFHSPLQNELDTFQENISVVIQDLPKDNRWDLDKYSIIAEKQIRGIFNKQIEVLYSGPEKFAGQKAHRVEFKIGADLRYVSVWTLDGHRAYQITYTAWELGYEQGLKKFEVLRKSFKINQEKQK